MYLRHQSEPLLRAFSARPFQGAEPKCAQFLFVGLDANFDKTVEQTPLFPYLLEYLADGVTFWRKYGLHHPFLLPFYKGDGRRYHATFSTIGFRPEHAAAVSFIELLHVPTYGRSALVPEDLDLDHLRTQFLTVPRVLYFFPAASPG